MKLDIHVPDFASSLPLQSVNAYLQSQGWEKSGPWGDSAAIHVKEEKGRNWELLVPLDDSLDDYEDVMERLIVVLSDVEERPEFEVYTALASIGSDAVHLSSMCDIVPAMSLANISDLYGNARDLLCHAARAAERSQAVYAGRPSKGVSAYIESVAALVNPFSDYALTLYSPVGSHFGEQFELDENNEVSFSRKTISKLASALTHTQSLVEYVDANEDAPGEYEEAVAAGVSSNLCKSIASLAEAGDGIKIDVHWAAIFPSAPLPRPFHFSQRSMKVLQEIAKDIRKKTPTYDDHIEGYVVSLDRGIDEFDGSAKIDTTQEDQPKQITVRFAEAEYEDVIKAFQARARVTLVGDIHPYGRGYELREPRSLEILSSA